MPEPIVSFLYNSWIVLGQMSPYLLLGFIISGILSVFISPEWVEKHLGGGRFASIVKATIFGIPLPLCSCGVIPVAASLRKHGASKAATTSFLLSTPQTGVDSIFATWGLLGGFFAVFRPLAALFTGVIGGVLVAVIDPEDKVDSINHSNESHPDAGMPFSIKLAAALKYGLVTLPGEIAKALLIGILIAGLISTFVAGNVLNNYLTNYYLTLVLMLLIGIPLYVCSTSSIPIALGFMHLGVSPGAALVFLISGPATNAAAISVVWKVLGRKSAVLYLLTVVIGSLLSGITFDAMNQQLSLNAAAGFHHCAESGLGTLETVSAIAMLLILAWSYYQARVTKDHCCCSHTSNDVSGYNFLLTIEGMSCGNCANAVKRTLLEVGGTISAEVDLQEKTARVVSSADNGALLESSVNELGYKASLIQR